MTRRFDSFVIFGEMRTGSNFLETNLNEFPDIFCMGEAFNPEFIGTPKTDQVLGYDVDRRDRDPHGLLQAFREQPDGLYGFRYFNGHDPRILETLLDDPRCAKVILYRNPVESFVSLQQVVTDDIQRACEKAFARDYDLYGFSNWEPAHRP